MSGEMRSLGLGFWTSFLAVSISLLASPSSSSAADQFTVDGTVLGLTESNFESAISSFDFIFVDFYATWCGHCKRLSPELDAAAPILSKQKPPIVVAKLDADKYSRLARKLEIDAFPTLKLYSHGVPMDYYGPRKADLLVPYLKKYVAPDVTVLESDTAIKDFIEDAGTLFPVFIGFGLNSSDISSLGSKYKKKAWFAVTKDFSEDAMVSYDFDKVPALVAKHPKHDEQNVFYGPFEDGFVEEFVEQNFLPLIVPMNHETLKLVEEEKRKIVLAIVEDESHESSGKLVKALRAAAHANRDLVFGYVGVSQFRDFTDSFHVDKKSKLPMIVVWDGDDEYDQVIGAEVIEEEDELSRVSKFLEGYREGRTEKKRIKEQSNTGIIYGVIGIIVVVLILLMIIVVMMIRSLGQDEEAARMKAAVADRSGGSEGDHNKARDKED